MKNVSKNYNDSTAEPRYTDGKCPLFTLSKIVCECSFDRMFTECGMRRTQTFEQRAWSRIHRLFPVLVLSRFLWRLRLQVGTRALAPHAGRLLVLVEITFQRERFSAAKANVRLFAGMRLDVRAQIRLIGERLIALGTFERLFARVRANVALQQPRSAEFLAAEGALAALVVRPDVHAEGRHRHVHFVAMRTFSRLFVGERSVRLPVSRQVAGRAVRLGTYRTDVSVSVRAIRVRAVGVRASAAVVCVCGQAARSWDQQTVPAVQVRGVIVRVAVVFKRVRIVIELILIRVWVMFVRVGFTTMWIRVLVMLIGIPVTLGRVRVGVRGFRVGSGMELLSDVSLGGV